MRMHAERMGAIVLEQDLDGISDLGMQNRADDAEILVFRLAFLEFLKSFVGIFAVDGFEVFGADAVRPTLSMHLGETLEGLAGHVIDTMRRIVPLHFVGCDIVGANFAAGRFRTDPLSRVELYRKCNYHPKCRKNPRRRHGPPPFTAEVSRYCAGNTASFGGQVSIL